MCRNWYGSCHSGAAKALAGKKNKQRRSQDAVSPRQTNGADTLGRKFGTVGPKSASVNARESADNAVQSGQSEANQRGAIADEQSAAEQSAVATAATNTGSNISEVLYATEVEYVMPMVVVVGTLELTATHLTFYGRQFGGPGSGSSFIFFCQLGRSAQLTWSYL